MALPLLSWSPVSVGYSADPRTGVVSTMLDGGVGKYRKDVDNQSTFVTVKWILDSVEYTALMFFYNTILDGGALPFEIDLIVASSNLTRHVAYVTPGSLKLSAQAGLSYTVTAKLEVSPIAVDSAGVAEQAALDALLDTLGPNWEANEDLLDQLVNVLLPDTLNA